MPNRVLLVEDDPATRLLLVRRLLVSGYGVLAAKDAEQALSILKDETVPLIVSDSLPGIDGVELCRHVKAHAELQPNYFILMTAKGDRAYGIKALEAGADDYISKPIDDLELLARLRAGERVLAQQMNLQNLASTDPLTGLRNRRCFEDDLEYEMAAIRRHGYPFSLLLLDLDDFKEINDRWGHAKGDDLLKLFGQSIVCELREEDRAYRIGGDEFAVILRRMWEMEAEKIAVRLRESFSLHLERRQKDLPFSASFSVGLATVYPGMNLSREWLLQVADRNMYLDKKGKNTRGGEARTRCAAAEYRGVVLIVENEPATRSLIQNALSEAGYMTFTAQNGENWLNAIKINNPDVLIINQETRGVEVCRTLRSNGRSQLPYLLMLFDGQESNSGVQASYSGADDFLCKPIEINPLLARVAIGMKFKRLQSEVYKTAKLKGVVEMARSAASEFSLPLNVLMESAHYLFTKSDENDRSYRYLKRIVERTERIKEITKKIEDAFDLLEIDPGQKKGNSLNWNR